MSLPRYEKYKESGTGWLGEVPDHWEVVRARTLGTFTASGIDKKIVEGEPQVRMFNYLDVYRSKGRALRYTPDLMVTTAPPEKIAEHAVRSDDILLTPSSETADDIGHAASVAEVPAGVVYSYHLLRFRAPRCDSRFLTYCFNSAMVRSYFASVCTGTTRMVLVREDFKNAPIALPPKREQAKIACFLDQETASIDALIAEQQRLIELLSEKRQAVISHAVTKGLNPDAPTKPSGIEWLGEVPAHWRILRLRHISPGITVGIVVEPSKYYVEEGVPALRSLNVRPGAILMENLVYISPEANEALAKSQLYAGDLVAVRSGQPGTTAIVPPELDGANCIDLIIIRKPREDSERFLCWYLGSDTAITQFGLGAGGALQQHFNIGTAADLIVPLPPRSEQDEIADYLERTSDSLDALTAEAERAIVLLQERRTALISAAVTGKIDVRGLVDSEPGAEAA